jgi:hypothetical protein
MDRKNDRPAGAGVVSAYARIRKIRREDDFFHINRPAPRFFCLMISLHPRIQALVVLQWKSDHREMGVRRKIDATFRRSVATFHRCRGLLE